VADELAPAVRTAVIKHVLRELYPDRREGTVVETAPLSDGMLVGVKVAPSGYISTAKYALVTVEDGQVSDAEPCSGKTLRQELAEQSEE